LFYSPAYLYTVSSDPYRIAQRGGALEIFCCLQRSLAPESSLTAAGSIDKYDVPEARPGTTFSAPQASRAANTFLLVRPVDKGILGAPVKP
jgi:hypothetical protein